MGKYDTKRSSFETIGWYVASDILGYNNVLKQYLSLISLNTLALNYEARDLYTNQATLILQWLEYILSSSNANEVFIISMHIGPGTDISNGIKYQWKEEYQILFETIIQKYKAKILSLFTGHTHHFRMMLPLYSTTNKTKSVLGINLSSFSPIKSNNPTFYFASFANDTGSIQFSDLSIYEIELTQLITRQKSLLSIANSAVALTNSTLDVTKITWGDRFESVISLFKLPSDTDQSIGISNILRNSFIILLF